jgi:hypothetical protein
MEDKIKEIISPHFGYLSLYLEWSKSCSLKKIEEFHTFLKNNKNVIQKLPIKIDKYPSYYKALIDIHNTKEIIKIKRFFKDGLNSSSRKYFEKSFLKNLNYYDVIMRDSFKKQMFFRNSSKPKGQKEYDDYVYQSFSFDTSLISIINKIENYQHYKIDDKYLIELNHDRLDLVPPAWCIYKDVNQFDNWVKDYHSIWLLVDPYNPDKKQVFTGIDVDTNRTKVYFMNSLNKRADSCPITQEQFFERTGIERNSKDYGYWEPKPNIYESQLTDLEIQNIMRYMERWSNR